MLDLFIFIFLLIGAVHGYFKGFFIQSLTLVALVAGIWGGIKLNPYFAGWLFKVFHMNESIAPYIAFVIIFVVIVLIMHFIAVLFTRIFDQSVVGALNKYGGALFGTLKMAFIASILLFLIQKFDPGKKLISEEAVKGSYLYKPVAKIAPTVFPHLHFDKIKKGIIGN
jgi:membrane protein required for colicin V production